MVNSFFKTNPVSLQELLANCQSGKLQLPDFQRSWVWDEDRIKSLIASISRAFPVGALMTLETGGGIEFKPRPVEGAPNGAHEKAPEALLLDGQQRMTSLYQVTLRNQVVRTVTPRKKRVDRWFYINIRAALDENTDREDAIVGVPADKVVRRSFGREVELDLSSREAELDNLMYPMTMVFNWDDWNRSWMERNMGKESFQEDWKLLMSFKDEVLNNFVQYQIPVIALDRSTSKEAVCVVFEKVNTGGKALDAFELITAMYAADGYELRKDWYGDASSEGRHRRLVRAYRPADAESGILANVANTDFLHVVSLFHTREKRREAEGRGKTGKDLPQVSGNRQSLLNLPLSAYIKYQSQAEVGFIRAAKFLHMLHIYRIFDLPYQSQIIPLAAVLADIGEAWEHEANRSKLVRWYWNGVFGELYGSTIDTRIARDFLEVPDWLKGGKPPVTASETVLRADRLRTMRMRLSAAYKGMNALLMLEGAKDFRSGQAFDHTVFFGEAVDIHHIFPRKWCEDRRIPSSIYDSIINKTPLSYRTNRIIGGAAPSYYLGQLERGSAQTPPIESDALDDYLRSHAIDPDLLRADDFDKFMEDRQRRLIELIERATGNPIYQDQTMSSAEEVDADEEEALRTISV